MTEPSVLRLRMAELTGNRKRAFDLQPDAAGRDALAGELGLIALPALRFQGELRPKGRGDVLLAARLTADAVQACVVTLAPVPVHLDQVVERIYVADMPVPEGDEIEMPADDSREPLPELLDLQDVLVEALALALPDYPRADGVELGEQIHAPPGVEPLRDEALKPFAGLAALRDRLKE